MSGSIVFTDINSIGNTLSLLSLHQPCVWLKLSTRMEYLCEELNQTQKPRRKHSNSKCSSGQFNPSDSDVWLFSSDLRYDQWHTIHNPFACYQRFISIQRFPCHLENPPGRNLRYSLLQYVDSQENFSTSIYRRNSY